MSLTLPSVVATRRMQTIVLAGLLALAAVPALGQTRPDRMSDRELKALIDEVDKGRDKFEGNLDGAFKGSTLRGPTGETKIAGALQDYQDNTKKLQQRFTSDYSASAEVTTVLKQSTAIDTFMQKSSSAMKGRSEWDRQTTNLQRLAAAYGTTFPLADGAAVRRMNDKETAAIATQIAAAADRFRKDLDKAPALPKPTKEVAKKDAELLAKQADAVKSRLSDGKPATGEVRTLAEQIAKLQAFADANAIPTTANWDAVKTSLGTLQAAFGLTP